MELSKKMSYSNEKENETCFTFPFITSEVCFLLKNVKKVKTKLIFIFFKVPDDFIVLIAFFIFIIL